MTTTSRMERIAFIEFPLRTTMLAASMAAIASVALASEPGRLTIHESREPGGWEIDEGGTPVLRYRYQMVAEPPDIKQRISPANAKYAVARCDYVHPLYGLRGETLTEDWSPDHPHHRGIYWAWPEVDWQGRRGDLHALQAVFARPTGQIRTERTDEAVAIIADSQWQWEDGTPIVREQATIRVRPRTAEGRSIDLQFRFVAIDADVLIARRETNLYGGLSIRLASAADQFIETFTDPADASPRRAWSQRVGTPPGATTAVGVTILQHPENPDYPGDWAQYPNLSWVQPTFPAANTRYRISRDRPLTLRYRLRIHEGRQTPETIHAWWDAYRAEAS